MILEEKNQVMDTIRQEEEWVRGNTEGKERMAWGWQDKQKTKFYKLQKGKTQEAGK